MEYLIRTACLYCLCSPSLMVPEFISEPRHLTSTHQLITCCSGPYLSCMCGGGLNELCQHTSGFSYHDLQQMQVLIDSPCSKYSCSWPSSLDNSPSISTCSPSYSNAMAMCNRYLGPLKTECAEALVYYSSPSITLQHRV